MYLEVWKSYLDGEVMCLRLTAEQQAPNCTGIACTSLPTLPTGSHAINPATGEAIAIWVADYVLGSYGSGAIMAVPAHDTRDFEFAQTFGLPVRQVVQCSEEEEELPTPG